MRATDEPANPHWVHTLAYLFAAENGGDVTDPVVNNAARAALRKGESVLGDLRRSARLHSTIHNTLVTHLATVTQALTAALRPGVLRQAQGCACGSFKGQPPAQASDPKPNHELWETIRAAGVVAAGGGPAADEWIRNALAWSGATPDQLICFAASMLATAENGTADVPGSDEHLVASILDTLLATRDQSALNALHHADPARVRHRQHLLLRRILTTLGDRAATVAREFHQHGGGHLANPAVLRAAQAALKTYDKYIYANARVTGLLDEDTYLLIITHLIAAEDDFELAARYPA